ncbi:MAG: phenylalanine--tRNA ligase subunit alpha [Acidiferrobacteraceae bacterium]
MTSVQQDLDRILDDARTELRAAVDLSGAEAVRVRYLGKKGLITEQLKRVGQEPAATRPDLGRRVNDAKRLLEEEIAAWRHQWDTDTLRKQLGTETLDVTLPGRGSGLGGLHPITIARARIEAILSAMGFARAEGPEIEDDVHNFEALNIPANHPARAMQDTFYFDAHTLLRTHTSNVQIRYMEAHSPPLRVVAAGRVFRADSPDLTHTPMFHQVEGLMVDEDVSFADLKGVLVAFLHAFFERPVAVRFRPSFFPFTEPSAEVDVRCGGCGGSGCRICKQSGWLEVLGCGMVHPSVFRHVGIDSERYTGFAFGAGIERLVMLRSGVTDARLFYENDLRFLDQFR